MKEIKLFISTTQKDALLHILDSYLCEYLTRDLPSNKRVEQVEDFIKLLKAAK